MTKNPEKNLKIAGETGVICKGVDPETGEVRDIYRNTNYDSSGLKPDILIAHVNGDEIREANGNSVNVSKTEIFSETSNSISFELETEKDGAKKFGFSKLYSSHIIHINLADMDDFPAFPYYPY